MENIIGILLGTLQLFYPLLLISLLLFVYALVVRSWKLMLLSGLIILPDAIYFSWYPPYPYAIFTPVIHLVIAFIFYYRHKRQKELAE
ncbi:hypothetical protein [Salirhabdus sp. Marseille-P4669]|uniref:hypothetical protein n=1 Tax=Salirhabdus sp. Marseille-P4669 TaxID=2042310 RepID=UPI000C79CA28|nr:hypothetical protein [Salirhabdus sp. Marseille-P4669]